MVSLLRRDEGRSASTGKEKQGSWHGRGGVCREMITSESNPPSRRCETSRDKKIEDIKSSTPATSDWVPDLKEVIPTGM